MLVVDASALAEALLEDGPSGDDARDVLWADDRWAAPHHLVVELLSVIRGRLLGRKITLERADEAVAALSELTIDKVDPTPLVPRIWELCGNMTAYDAAYVAAAESQNCPLVTGDARLARARGVRCEIRLTGGR
ncbi:type II toxin-antitoxin system VapC family toxin [Goodfellowiella coeruleoviolacea]|uniref:Ribonuclease VapC n=1 Tax=Goodfellowiella coeruleoviolacea TaxID=334858 RepID=A0AAE3GC33_9PSEU|nr:type II toxin-antitoxin system VapC family toxin [Goodfellowiella coeruleoviolacea]MCP2165551.1 putative nucleic acid-binding protein, contains PIN domain [Goodfellowiella coeruleoviolacea]